MCREYRPIPATKPCPYATVTHTMHAHFIWTHWHVHEDTHSCILNKIINAPSGTLKLLLALGVAKYIKSYKIHFVVQYATDYCPLEHDNYKTISAHLGSPIHVNNLHNLHGAFIFLLSVYNFARINECLLIFIHENNYQMSVVFCAGDAFCVSSNHFY